MSQDLINFLFLILHTAIILIVFFSTRDLYEKILKLRCDMQLETKQMILDFTTDFFEKFSDQLDKINLNIIKHQSDIEEKNEQK